MNIQETVDFQLRSTLFAMRRMYNLLAAENGITQGIGYALVNIGKDGIPSTKIAPMMGMTASSLSRLLKKMEDDGLVYKGEDKIDKRVTLIFLTKKGIEIKKQVEEVVLDFNHRLMKKLNKKDLTGFVKVNEIIRDQVCEDVEAFHNRS
jgi:DNA-binding MarR family transcriptional regulator